MDVLLDLVPWFIPLTLLVSVSAFFSASEAALFCLSWQERRQMAAGSKRQQLAVQLLADPERLLSAVLFWNLVVNLTYFVVASMVSLELERDPRAGRGWFVSFTAGTLLALVLCGEMLPKNLGVLGARRLAGLIAAPLALAVRAADPLMPALRLVTLLSRRLLWPGFRPEPYLELSDLERAVEVSGDDAQLVEQEQKALRNIVQLSEIRADEWMQPRTQFTVVRPPVARSDLAGRTIPGGYALVSEPRSEEIAAAIALYTLHELPDEHLDRYAEPVGVVPWCATVADVLEQMIQNDRDVAVIVNELGESIGILTFDDLVRTVLRARPLVEGRLLGGDPIQPSGENAWRVRASISLRRLARYFELSLPPSHSVTLAGALQEALQRLAEEGDELDWGPFRVRVLEAPFRGQLVVELTRQRPVEEHR